MRAHLEVTRPVESAEWPVIERFLASPDRWLPLPSIVLADGRITSTLRLGPLLQLVSVTVGEAWSLPDAVSRTIAWEPTDEHGTRAHPRALPGFEGRLTLRHAEGEITLGLEGVYVPPGGRVGATADRVVLRRSGESTAHALLDDICNHLLGVPAHGESS